MPTDLKAHAGLLFAVAVWIQLVVATALPADDASIADRDTGDPIGEPRGMSLPAEFVEELEQAEQLYAELHFVVSSVYEVKTLDTVDGETLLSEESFTAWRKGAKMRTEANGTSHSFLHDNDSSRLVVTDGERTWSLDRYSRRWADQRDVILEQAYGSLRLSSPIPLQVRPHTYLLQNYEASSLSAFFRGKTAVAAQPGVDVEDVPEFFVTDQGETEWSNLMCRRVDLERRHGATENFSMRLQFWLARDRNWIPVRILEYRGVAPDVLSSEQLISEWQEVEPDVWFPKQATTTKFTVFGEHPDAVRWTREYQFESVRLSVDDEEDLFRPIEFPDDVPVSEEQPDGSFEVRQRPVKVPN